MIYLVTGAGASGKSEYAEKLATDLAKEPVIKGPDRKRCPESGAKLYYVATMDVRDEESRLRVKRHRQMRSGKGFETIERSVDIASLYIEETDAVVLLEDLSNLLANEMYGANGPCLGPHDFKRVDDVILNPLLKLADRVGHLIIVTNEIFTGTDERLDFTEYLGYLNRKLAQKAFRLVEVVDKIPLEIAPTGNSGDKTEIGTTDGNMKLTFITGGICQGKTEYAKKYMPGDYVIDELDLKLREAMKKAQEAGEAFSSVDWIRDLLKKAGNEAGRRGITVIGCENGCGLVPMDAFLRNYRDENGRMNCYLASEADTVIRMISGIPQVLRRKPKKKGRILLIRHGATAGNLRKCFVGSTDEPLCESGVEELLRLKESFYDHFLEGENLSGFFVSPMARCRRTAEILFPGKVPQIVENLHECDFGIMDGKNHEEMMEDPEYRAFLEEENPTAFPGGEGIEEFLNRCSDAFYDTILANRTVFEVQEDPLFVFVIHGGTCMGILNRFSDEEKSYYEWNPQNGKGYLADLEIGLQDTLKVSNIRLIPKD